MNLRVMQLSTSAENYNQNFKNDESDFLLRKEKMRKSRPIAMETLVRICSRATVPELECKAAAEAHESIAADCPKR